VEIRNHGAKPMANLATYCNPLSIPDLQPSRNFLVHHAEGSKGFCLTGTDPREMADPTVIRFRGRWYLFPSCGMLWHSDDMVNWTYHRIEPHDPGYAPTVVQKGDYLYLTAGTDKLWRAMEPFGPWELLGTFKDRDGRPQALADPMLFVDDDGWMYLYHGCGDGIYAIRLKDDDPTAFDTPPLRVRCPPKTDPSVVRVSTDLRVRKELSHEKVSARADCAEVAAG